MRALVPALLQTVVDARVNQREDRREDHAGVDLVTGRTGPFFFEAELDPGPHALRLFFLADDLRVDVYDQTVVLQPGQILRLALAEPPPAGLCRGEVCLP